MGDNGTSTTPSSICDEVAAVFNITGVLEDKFSDSARLTELVIYVVGFILLFFSCAVTGYYMKFRIHEYDRLKARSFPVIVAGHLGAFVQLHTGSLEKVVFAKIPCNLYSILSLMVVPLILLPVSVKLIQLRKQDFLTRAAAQGVELDESDKTNSYELHDGEERAASSARTSERVSRLFSQSRRLMVIMLGGDPDTKRKSRKDQTVTTVAAESATAVQNNNTTTLANAIALGLPQHEEVQVAPGGLSMRVILLMRYSAGTYGALVTLALVNVPFILMTLLSFAFVHPIYFTSCLGCVLSYTHEYFIATEGFLATALVVFLMYVTKIKRDPFGVKQEIWLVLCVGCIPALISFILTFVRTPGLAPGFSFNQIVAISLVSGSLCQGWLQVLLAQRDAQEIRHLHEIGVDVEEEVGGEGGRGQNEGGDEEEGPEAEQRDRVESLGVRKERDGDSVRTGAASSSHRISVGTNYAGLLQLVLADPVFKNAFHAHLCDEHNVEPLTFIDGVDRWKRHFGGSSPETAHRRAKRIMKSYVGPRAPFRVPLSSSQVDILIRKTARPETLTYDTFDGARAEMLKTLEYGPLVRFTKSSIWKGFVEDGLVAEVDHGYGLSPQRALTRNSSAAPASPGSPSDTAVTPTLAVFAKTASSRSNGSGTNPARGFS